MTKQQLANKIWESANKLRSKIEASEYKDYILGFIFYKFLSDNEVSFLTKKHFRQSDIEALDGSDQKTVKYIRDNIYYFLPYESLFSTWLADEKFSVSDVKTGITNFVTYLNPAHEDTFAGIFNTLDTNLTKLGPTPADQTTAIIDLLLLIKDIPMDGKQGYDVLGYVYEYLIGQFASHAGKKAGEFYTPHEVSLLMSEIIADHLKDRKEIKIYDPTSGSGSLLINIGKASAKMNEGTQIKYYAQELKENTYNITRMNLIMRGISPANMTVRNGDTLDKDWPFFKEGDFENTYDPLYVDAVVSNPPYSQNWKPHKDKRFNEYGLAPKGKADFAFLLHDLFHLQKDGIMTIVLPHGVLFRGSSDDNSEGSIRKNLIEKNNLDTIIGLPADIFFGTGIPTIIMVLKKEKTDSNVLIIDASKHFIKADKKNKLQSSDIKRIVDAVKERKNIPYFASLVSREKIRKNDYNLNIPRYIDSSEKPDVSDIYATMFGGYPKAEVQLLNDYWEALPALKDVIFKDNGSPYLELKVQNIEEIVNKNKSVLEYKKNFESHFEDFESYLHSRFIDKGLELNLNKEEEIITDNIYNRIKDIPLTDKYEAFQIFDDQWATISNDLEILQIEGFQASKQVDRHYVIKKKDDKECEVEDGWQGHVLPFEIVQNELLKDDLATIADTEGSICKVQNEEEELFATLSAEELEEDFVTEEKAAFVPKEVEKYMTAVTAELLNNDKATKKAVGEKLKAILKENDFEEDSIEARLAKVMNAQNKEKDLNKTLKKQKAELYEKTKITIESLTDDQVKNLLVIKWIKPLVAKTKGMSDEIIAGLLLKLKALVQKYSTTFKAVQKSLNDSEKKVNEDLSKLCGSEFDISGIKEFQKLLAE